MIIEVIRMYFKDTYTIGKLYIDGVYLCDTLEDKVRPLGEKVYGQTAIPEGTYELRWAYSPKFKRNLPRVIDVPGFKGVLIHPGNVIADTEGCILPGENKAKGLILDSRKYSEIINEVCERESRKGKMFIKIINQR